MSIKKAPYDDKNAEDYSIMTIRIAAGLKEIESNENIPATEKSLAGIVGCSRGTLRNRIDPLVKLKLIKEARKKKIKLKGNNLKNKINEAQSSEKKLLEQLDNSRCEIAVWVDKYKEIESEIKRLRRANDLLKAENKLIKSENKELKEKLIRYEYKEKTSQSDNVVKQFNRKSDDPKRNQTG